MTKSAILIAVAIVACAVAAATASTAAAARKPTAAERKALAHAVHAPAHCLRIRVATVRRGWASVRARMPPSASCQGHVGDGVVVLRRRDGVWRQRFAGSAWACPIPGVPEAVRKDLRLGCPEGGP